MNNKYVVLLGDGMGDYPLPELGNRTPLEAASTPAMDYLAERGSLGLVQTIPKGMPKGSDVANLSIMGMTLPSTTPAGLPWRQPIWGSPSRRMKWPTAATW